MIMMCDDAAMSPLMMPLEHRSDHLSDRDDGDQGLHRATPRQCFPPSKKFFKKMKKFLLA